jgi:hypothetical protein
MLQGKYFISISKSSKYKNEKVVVVAVVKKLHIVRRELEGGESIEALPWL